MQSFLSSKSPKITMVIQYVTHFHLFKVHLFMYFIVCHGVPVEVRGKLLSIGSVLPPLAIQNQESSCQACAQALLLVENLAGFHFHLSSQLSQYQEPHFTLCFFVTFNIILKNDLVSEYTSNTLKCPFQIFRS